MVGSLHGFFPSEDLIFVFSKKHDMVQILRLRLSIKGEIRWIGLQWVMIKRYGE